MLLPALFYANKDDKRGLYELSSANDDILRKRKCMIICGSADVHRNTIVVHAMHTSHHHQCTLGNRNFKDTLFKHSFLWTTPLQHEHNRLLCSPAANQCHGDPEQLFRRAHRRTWRRKGLWVLT